MTDRPLPKPGILQISPYVPGKAAVEGVAHPLKLSANENILGSSPAAREAFASAIDELHLYPDGRCNALREAISARYGLEPENLLFGCGSDEIFQLIGQTFIQPGDNAVQGEHGFGAFAIATRAAGGEVRMAREIDLRIDVDEVLDCVDERTRIVWIANPANPTGTVVGGSEFRRLHAALPADVVLVLDGAYAEFAEDPDFEDGVDLVRNASNVIMTRTFSKIYGLALLRLGWCYGPAGIIDALNRIRGPFNVNGPAIAAGIAALHYRFNHVQNAKWSATM
jgi:histidinol-phosphate aminotransferase